MELDLIQKGIKKNLIKLDEEAHTITYIHQNKKRNYANPEEKIQAEATQVLEQAKQEVGKMILGD